MGKAQREKGLPMTETDLRRSIVAAARECGWLVSFAWTSIHSPRGLPDLTLCHPERHELIYFELKSAKGKVSEPQQTWLDALAQVTSRVEARVIRPADLEDAYRRLAGQLTRAEAEFEASLPKPSEIRGIGKDQP